VWLLCIFVLVFNVFCSYHNWSHQIMRGIERHEYIWKDFYSPYLIGSTNIGDCSSDFLSCECAASSIYGSFYFPDLGHKETRMFLEGSKEPLNLQ